MPAMLLRRLLIAATGAHALTSSCYFRDGSTAVIGDQAYVQCPGLNSCCLPTDTCVSNGLCRDINNHQNGSLTTLSDGSVYNYTGLYQTPACSNAQFDGCDLECTSAYTDTREYLWACNTELTQYCCHNSSLGLAQGDCCSGDDNFVLASPTVVSSSASSTSSTQSSTSSGTTSSSVSAETTTSIPSSTTTSASTSARTRTGSASSSELSKGAKIGVGVGTALGVILIATLIALGLYIRKLRNNRESTHRAAEQPVPAHGQDYMPVTQRDTEPMGYMAEAPTTRDPAELQGDYPYHKDAKWSGQELP